MKDKKVLIVDDEDDFCFLMTDFFSQKGYDVFLANSIATGLDLLRKEKPDYLLLDNNLPDGLGWGKTEFIIANYPTTRLLLMSATEVPKTNASSFKILHKPTITDELNKIV
jgi:DNA-binding response OmpR family regulator